jgi:hypothetical protein
MVLIFYQHTRETFQERPYLKRIHFWWLIADFFRKQLLARMLSMPA